MKKFSQFLEVVKHLRLAIDELQAAQRVGAGDAYLFDKIRRIETRIVNLVFDVAIQAAKTGDGRDQKIPRPSHPFIPGPVISEPDEVVKVWTPLRKETLKEVTR